MNGELIQKPFKNFNLTTTNAILMKLTMTMYLRKVFDLPKTWGVTHRL